MGEFSDKNTKRKVLHVITIIILIIVVLLAIGSILASRLVFTDDMCISPTTKERSNVHRNIQLTSAWLYAQAAPYTLIILLFSALMLLEERIASPFITILPSQYDYVGATSLPHLFTLKWLPEIVPFYKVASLYHPFTKGQTWKEGQSGTQLLLPPDSPPSSPQSATKSMPSNNTTTTKSIKTTSPYTQPLLPQSSSSSQWPSDEPPCDDESLPPVVQSIDDIPYGDDTLRRAILKHRGTLTSTWTSPMSTRRVSYIVCRRNQNNNQTSRGRKVLVPTTSPTSLICTPDGYDSISDVDPHDKRHSGLWKEVGEEDKEQNPFRALHSHYYLHRHSLQPPGLRSLFDEIIDYILAIVVVFMGVLFLGYVGLLLWGTIHVGRNYRFDLLCPESLVLQRLLLTQLVYYWFLPGLPFAIYFIDKALR